MRNLFAALLLLASAPLTRQKMIEDVVRFSHAEEKVECERPATPPRPAGYHFGWRRGPLRHL